MAKHKVQRDLFNALLVLVLVQVSSGQGNGQFDRSSILSGLQTADREAEQSIDTINSRSFLASERTSSIVREIDRKVEASIRGSGGSGGSEGPDGVIGPQGIRPPTGIECVFNQQNTAPCNSQFREHSGRCSNIQSGRRSWGMAGTAFERVLPPRYENGVDKVRTTEFRSGGNLKSAREISTTVTSTQVRLEDNGVSSHVMQWGQFSAHDFTLIVDSIPDQVCCPDKLPFVDVNTLTPTQITLVSNLIKELRKDCIQIENFNDVVYGRYHCMRQTRSKDVPTNDCSGNQRQQMNSISHVFDASNVYGSSLSDARSLRDSSGGRMKVQVVNGVTLPPPVDNGRCEARRKQSNRCPFAGGDERINVTPNLITFHTMFLVVHNKIARQLQSINPSWDNERLYQETRRIVSAINSNIQYYEYLPILLGNRIIRQYNLNRHTGFKSNTKPIVLNEMAAGAYRLHTLINGIFTVIPDGERPSSLNLRDQFFRRITIYNKGIRQCVRGLTSDKPWKVDRFFPTQMRDQLFRMKEDIVSFNIGRGRDHGLASYLDYRRHYRLFVPRSWNDMSRTHPSDAVAKLQQAYKHVEDIELYPGGITEKPADGLLGELFSNIIGDGFRRLRDGDRFFFEASSSGLATLQIREIRKYTLAHLFCEGSDIDEVPDKAFFRFERPGVQRVQCSSLSKLNLKLWKDGPKYDECQWKNVARSRCCGGRRIVIRTCQGASASCQCQGSRIIVERCSPNHRLCLFGFSGLQNSLRSLESVGSSQALQIPSSFERLQ